jgi:Tol biopolymer transport system component
MLAMVTMLVAAGTARAAGPGDVILTGGLPLPAGAIAGGNSGYGGGEPTRIAVSADGRYVAFASDADALSSEAHLDVTNIFRKDRATGEVLLVGRATGAGGAVPLLWGGDVTISDDGGRVAWVTRATLDPADTDEQEDVYVRDIATATTFLATPGTTDDLFGYDLSGDGTYVAFDTVDALAGINDTNAARDVYRRAVGGGGSTLVSRTTGTPQAATGASADPGISDNGRWVAFSSEATDVVAGFVDGGGSRDVYVRDMTAGTPYLVSNQSGAALTGANGTSGSPVVAGAPGAAVAGVYVAYNTDATNVTTAGVDTSGAESVYRRRLSESSAALVSRATGVGGANADSRAHVGGITDDGSRVVFASDAGNLGAGADYYGSYVRDLGAATTALASADNAYAVQPEISDDGAVVAWINGSAGITPDGDADLIGVFARAGGGAPELVSRPPGSAPFLAPATPIQSAAAGARTISADGRYVVFTAYSTRLPGNPDGIQRV